METPPSRPGEPDIVAVSDDLRAARAAIAALESAGIDGTHIELIGEVADEARVETENEEPDRQVVGFLSRRAVAGAVVGALAGAAAGAVAGTAAMLLVGGGVAIVLLAVVVGALVGSTVDMFFAVERSAGFSPDWELTFPERPGDGVRVAVRAPSRELRDRAVTALRSTRGVHGVEVRSRG